MHFIQDGAASLSQVLITHIYFCNRWARQSSPALGSRRQLSHVHGCLALVFWLGLRHLSFLWQNAVAFKSRKLHLLYGKLNCS